MAARWIDNLTDEDLAFLKRFVLASGSLKDLAAAYAISYPTVRLRLDRLIQKIKLLDESEIMSDFERAARALCIDGKIDPQALRQLLAVHQREMEKHHDTADPDRIVRLPGRG